MNLTLPSVKRAAPGRLARSPAMWLSLAAGLLTPFTISLVGEMPLGEFALTAAALWACLCCAMQRTLPGPLFHDRYFWALLTAQLVAFCAYVASDLYRHSKPHDMARGWSRMAILAVDCVAIAYLFGRNPGNFVALVVGKLVGDLAHFAIAGAMFGDVWKFGLGAPVTYFVVLAAPAAGFIACVLSAFGIAAANLSLDYRSLGGICLATAIAALGLKLRPYIRWWLLPVGLATVIAASVAFYAANAENARATRSDIERTAMIQAALDAFESSPLIGSGSWFSNTDVYDNFLSIRHAMAQSAHLGGFADANTEPGDTALHSQLLVAMAEGGFFGGAFFLVYGAGLVWALSNVVLIRRWHPLSPFITLCLLSAGWDLLFSPFSGAHRVGIAEACGLILVLRRGWPAQTASRSTR